MAHRITDRTQDSGKASRTAPTSRGYIREKGHGWEVVVSAGIDPATKRRRRVSRYITGTRRDAERALMRLILEVGDNPARAGSGASVEDLLATWLSLAELSPTTLERYRTIARVHILPAIGSVKLAKLDAARLDRLFRDLSATRAPRTVRQVKAVIHRALKQGVRWGWIDRNVADNATTPAVHRAEVHAPDAEVVARLVDAASTDTVRGQAAPDLDLADFVFLAATTGARRGELCGLQWSDVELDGGELVIRRAVIEVRGQLSVKGTKTHAVRRVALDPATVALLRERRVRTAAVGPWVFGADHTHQEPWPPETVSARFRVLARRAAPGVRLHDLRHFAATMLLDAGVAVPTVSRRLGHRDAATTLGIYGHAVEASDRLAAEVLGAAVTRRR